MKLIFGIPVEKLTLLAIIIIGSFYLFVLPFNTAPDEPTHYKSAYQNVDAILGQTSEDVNSIAMRAADAEMSEKYDGLATVKSYESVRESLFEPLPDGGGAIVEVSRPSGVPHPYIYLPQTLGMLLGRALQANPEWLYLLGRIFNLIFYAVCVWMSVKIAPIGKAVIALVALYPMCMELAASLNSDIYSISLAFLAIAQYLKIAYSDEPAKLKELLLLLLTMALLGPPKVVFIPLMMLAFFMPRRCFPDKKTSVIFRILVAVVCAAVTFFALYVYIHRTDGGTPVVTFPGITPYTPEQLLADPLMFAKTCYRTMLSFFGYYLYSMIGSDLGWIEIHLNKGLMTVFLALSAAGAFKAAAAEKTLLLRDRIQFPVIFLIMALGTAIIMYISWTNVGSWDIQGIQGRYFAPLWPLFILFAARWKQPVRPFWLSDRVLVLAACCLNIIVLVTVYGIIAAREA